MLPAQACDQSVDCIEKQSWQLGVALGAGLRSNPLVDGDNIPLFILPDIAWYGDKLYLDNDEFGYQWSQSKHLAVETFVSLNKEAANFTFWHPSNILTGSSINTGLIGPSQVPERRVSKDEVASRKWALNAGVRMHIRGHNSDWQIALLTDASDVHRGQQFELGYHYRMDVASWSLSIAPALIWKSSDLVDYYYGLDGRDEVERSLYYQGKAGWQPSLSVLAIRPLTENWQLLIKASWTRLHKGMTDSPLVEENSIQGVFIGTAYRF
ncbi:MipA/OmpV family protein [Bowmanella dokdonensis]